MISKFNSLLASGDKKKLILLTFFSIFIAFVETFAVAVIMPFIDIASDFTQIQSKQYYKYVYDLLQLDSEINFIFILGVGLIVFYIIRFFLNLYYTYVLGLFARDKYRVLSTKLLEHYLKLPYDRFTNKNTGELTKNIVQETQNLSYSIFSALQLVSEVFVFLFVYILMLVVNYKITLIISLLLGLCLLFLFKTVSVRIKAEGKNREKCQRQFYEITTSSFGNFKLLKLLQNNFDVIEEFDIVNQKYARSNILKDLLSTIPKLFIETFAFSILLMSIVFIIYFEQTNISNYMPIISLFVLSLYRLMPSINRIMSNYNNIIYHHKSFDIIYEALHEKIEVLDDKKIDFKNKICLNNVNFNYETNQKKILENINLEIEKSDKIAFIGESGSGKSTLVDIIIGLHTQTKGQILIDNIELKKDNLKNWRSKVGYIPQTVYLFDGNVAENIALGLEIDEDKVRQVLATAKMLNFLENNLDGIYTKVGEGGVKLSGGQKQRIAIARALYKDPEILVLDEATSALDEATEKEIMQEIYNIADDRTLIIIAHRLSTIQHCNKIYRVSNKSINLVNK